MHAISRSLSHNDAFTVHRLVCSRIDCCSAIYVTLPFAQIEGVLLAAAGLVGGSSTFGPCHALFTLHAPLASSFQAH